MLDKEMPADSFKVHGLTLEFLSDKPLFSEIIVNLINFIGNARLIIHNAKFDIGFINYEIQMLQNSSKDTYESLPYKEVKEKNVVDTLEIAKKLYPGKSVSLDSLCVKFGISNKRKGKHGALIDCEILSEVYLELEGGKQPGFHFSQLDNAVTDADKKQGKKFLLENTLYLEIGCPKGRFSYTRN